MQRLKAVLTLLAAIAFLLSPLLSSGFNGFSAGQFPIPQVVRPDTPEYSMAVIWALIGVIVSNIDPLNWAVLGLAGVGVAALGLVAWVSNSAP